ncbi:MAG: hypothetical protein JRJ85_01450 [Deltaproteobacteria bacterium]|nr:hypothetical protein [Deltaproteobacteria bacterium]
MSKDKDDDEKFIGLLGKAKKAFFLNLLKKIQSGKTLAAHEQKIFEEFEAHYNKSQAGPGKRILSNQKELAEYLGRSTRMISYYKSEGMPVNLDGTYDLDDIDTWWETRNKKGIGQPHGEPVDEGEVGGKSFWDTFYREFRGKREELLFKQLKGELIPKSLVDDLLETRAVEFKKALAERNRRLSLKCAHKTSEEIQKLLDDDTQFILQTYSRGHTLSEIQMRNGED